MSIVIIGGHERMVCKYKEICKQYSCKAKIFTEMPANLKSTMGSPDIVVLFTSTVSHNMVKKALAKGEQTGAKIVRSHSSSACALKGILAECMKGNCTVCDGRCSQCRKKNN